jgi:hypothetical protein
MGAWAKPEEFSNGELELYPNAVRGTRTFGVTRAGWLVGIFFQQPWLPGWNQAHNWKRLNPSVDHHGNMEAVCPQREQDALMGGSTNRFGPYRSDWFRAASPAPMDAYGARWGFYAYNDASNDFHADGDIYATVEGRGRLCVGSRGFRAPEARVVALVFTENVEPVLRARVCVNYPNVEFYPTFEAMVADLPPDHFKES